MPRLIETVGTISPEEIVAREDTKMAILRMLASLSALEERIVRLRFGIGGHDEQTRAKIAEEMYLSQDSVRRIEEKAIRNCKRFLRADAGAPCSIFDG